MYASMVLMCILLSILFLGGYLAPDFINLINDLLNILDRFLKFMYELNESVTDLIDFYESRLYGLSIFFDLISIFISDSLLICSCVLEFILAWILIIFEPLLENISGFITLIYNTLGSELLYSLIIALKSSVLIFMFIWGRACFPRIRFDELMSLCWTVFLPILFGIIILVPCIISSNDILSANVFFMTSPLVKAHKNSALRSRVEFNRRSNSNDSNSLKKDSLEPWFWTSFFKNHLDTLLVFMINYMTIIILKCIYLFSNWHAVIIYWGLMGVWACIKLYIVRNLKNSQAKITKMEYLITCLITVFFSVLIYNINISYWLNLILFSSIISIIDLFYINSILRKLLLYILDINISGKQYFTSAGNIPSNIQESIPPKVEWVLTKDGENTPSTEKTVDPVGPNDPAGPLPAQEDISRGRSRILGRSISPREDGSGSMRRFRERSPQSRLPGNMENINPQVDAKEAELEAEKLRKEKENLLIPKEMGEAEKLRIKQKVMSYAQDKSWLKDIKNKNAEEIRGIIKAKVDAIEADREAEILRKKIEMEANILNNQLAERWKELPWKSNNPTDQEARARWAGEQLEKLYYAKREELAAKYKVNPATVKVELKDLINGPYWIAKNFMDSKFDTLQSAILEDVHKNKKLKKYQSINTMNVENIIKKLKDNK